MLLPSPLRGASGRKGGSIGGSGAHALAPLQSFVETYGLKAPVAPTGPLTDFKFLLQEWQVFDRGQLVPGFTEEFGYFRIIRRKNGNKTVYQLDRNEPSTRIRAKITRHGGFGGRLDWEITQTPLTEHGKDLRLDTEVRGMAADGQWERTVNGRRESGELTGLAVADCELLVGGIDLNALTGAGEFTFFSHEACFQGQAACRLHKDAPITVSMGAGDDLRLTPFLLTGPKHQPQHYLVPEGRDYAAAYTEFAVSMTLESIS